jgi:hypothetical protein
MTTKETRLAMIRDEYERLHGEDDVVCEVGRGSVGTGRLHIDLPAGALRHLAEQVPGLDVDFETGRAWIDTRKLVAEVRKIAKALATAK